MLDIPGYEVLEQIGEGANATVYRARHVKLDRIDAIKVLKPKLAENAKFIARLEAEGRTVAQLKHENIVTVYDVMTHIPTPCLVMEYVGGGSLHDLLQRDGKVEEKLAMKIVIQIASGLKAAHAQRMVHGDIKPRNVLFKKNGQAKIVDFGLAQSLYTEVVRGRGSAGTPLYNSPEQIRGDADLDSRVDLYNLGATFYHMVTGRPPFLGKTPDEVIRQHLIEEPEPPDKHVPKLNSGLCRIIETLLAKNANERYGSADQLIEDLRCLLQGRSPMHVNDPAAMAYLAQIEEESDAELVDITKPIFTRQVLIVLLILSMAMNALMYVLLMFDL